jgi:hypothetical protein
MTARSYASAESFKQALEQRLRTGRTGAELARKRQLLVFDRFLARVVAALGDAATQPRRHLEPIQLDVGLSAEVRSPTASRICPRVHAIGGLRPVRRGCD